MWIRRERRASFLSTLLIPMLRASASHISQAAQIDGAGRPSDQRLLDTASDPHTVNLLQPPPTLCGNQIDAIVQPNGTITSPGFPENYPAFLNCTWTITAGPGKKILLNFSVFDITASTGCTSDYIVVRSGGAATSYCGQTAPGQITSADQTLVLEFHTNQGDSCKGFSVDYTTITRQVTCGAISSDLQFKFSSPAYPEQLANETALCDLTVSHDCDTPICQVRLDLLDFRLGPPTLGDCNADQFIVRANEPLPVLCGENSNQHLYVDVRGRKETHINILSTPIFPKPVGVRNETDGSRIIIQWLHEVDPNRGWDILVTQIPCSCGDSPLPDPLAPTGCLQYHTGVTGVVSSFNYFGSIMNYEPCWNGTEPECGARMNTGHLNNLDYTVCFESQPGYCGIVYSQVDSSSFQLTGIENSTVPIPLNGEGSCSEDYLYIPRGLNPADWTGRYSVERYCGQVLGNRLVSPILSYAKPFTISMKSNGSEPYSGVALHNRGFNLEYSQIPCSLDQADALNFA